VQSLTEFGKIQNLWSHNFFWRTYDQKEIDWIEEREGTLHAYEIKWGKTSIKAPKLWLENYPESTFTRINQENYLPFIS
jgi:hypothetical protein